MLTLVTASDTTFFLFLIRLINNVINISNKKHIEIRIIVYNLGMTNRVRYITLKNYFHEHGLVPDDVIEVDLLYKETQSTTVYTMKTLSRKDKNNIINVLCDFDYTEKDYIRNYKEFIEYRKKR